MGEPSSPPTASPARDRRRQDRWVKLGFLAVTLIAVAAIWALQRRPPMLEGWADDLPSALEQARREGRRVLAFFMYSPPGQAERRVATSTIPKNRTFLREGNYLCVKVSVSTGLKDRLAQEYRIQEVPTLAILDPQGRELGRRSGMVGEMELRHFLQDPNRPAGP